MVNGFQRKGRILTAQDGAAVVVRLMVKRYQKARRVVTAWDGAAALCQPATPPRRAFRHYGRRKSQGREL